MTRATIGLMAGALLLTGATACAEWSAPPIDQWADAISLEGSDTERPPHGEWAVQDGAVVGTGLTRFWGQRVMPGDPRSRDERPSAQRVRVAFTVEESAGRDRRRTDHVIGSQMLL